MPQEDGMRHEWKWVPARTPSGKTRMVRRCKSCNVVTYPHYGMHRWVYPDGSVRQNVTVDEPYCRVGQS